MHNVMFGAVISYKFLLALAASVFAAGCGFAADLTSIRLPGSIAPDADVGLAVSAPNSLYAGYWVNREGSRPWQLVIYEFNIATGKVVSKAEVDEALPPQSRNGDSIQSAVRMSISPDGSMLLCATVEHGPVHKSWTLSSRDLHILSSRTIPADTKYWGLAKMAMCVCSAFTRGERSDKRSIRLPSFCQRSFAGQKRIGAGNPL